MKQIALKHALSDRPNADDFTLIEVPAPACPDGGVVLRVVHLSLDPYIGSRLRGRHMGEPAPAPMIAPIPGGVVGQVIESRTAAFAPGDWVHSTEGVWAEHVALPGHAARKLDPRLAPLGAHAGVLGMPGLTAWAGITQLAQVRPGDVVLVDAAAGAVGGAAGQIARAMGAKKVIGVAGGPQKCALVEEIYGFDVCIDDRAPHWEDALDAACAGSPPSVHFENVSVAMLTAALVRMAPYGRAILCGLVDQYHASALPPQIPAGLIIGKRAQLHGLVVYDFYPRWSEYIAWAAPLLKTGHLRAQEDRVTGLENAPALFEKLMRGENVGKAVVTVSAE
jgi:NADPH-dependent curcumin reductase CurA